MKNVLQPQDLEAGQATSNAEVYTSCLLVRLLTDEYSLFLQTLQALWQSKYTADPDEHNFLEWQFDKMTELTDILICRVNLGGHFYMGDINDYMWMARLPELLGEEPDADIRMGELLRGHTTLVTLLEADIGTLRAEKGSESTIRFLEHFLEQHCAIAHLIRNYPDWAFPGAGKASATVLGADFQEAILRHAS